MIQQQYVAGIRVPNGTREVWKFMTRHVTAVWRRWEFGRRGASKVFLDRGWEGQSIRNGLCIFPHNKYTGVHTLQRHRLRPYVSIGRVFGRNPS